MENLNPLEETTIKRKHLHKPRNQRDDEWFTTKKDALKSLQPFAPRLARKKLYLPCDDWRWSNFYIVLNERFDDWKIEEIVATHLRQNEADDGDCIRVYRDEHGNRQEEHFTLETGNCLSAECDPYWNACEICITNPPFSLYSDFFARVEQAECDYVLIAPLLIVSRLDMFDKWQKGQFAFLKLTGSLSRFLRPDGSTANQACLIVTNFIEEAYAARPETRNYTIEKLDNVDAWNVPALSLLQIIPEDDPRIFAVPVTYAYSDLPDQWEVVGLRERQLLLNGKQIFARMYIRRPRPDEQPEA